MKVVAIVENWNGKFKKTSFETLSYAKKLAKKSNLKLSAITFGSSEPELLKIYGADEIINISNLKYENTSNTIISKICSDLINEHKNNITIVSNTNFGKSICPLLATKINSGLISNAIEMPTNESKLTVKCKGFSSKAYITYQSNFTSNIISILPNSIGEIEKIEGEGKIINMEKEINNIHCSINIINREQSNEKISLNDADIVVSAGRGLKAPENWEMIEELAETLDAGTACSKPVSDMGWRPHSEHVGQTGIAINPELYIAIGISGAIQHLAGVNSSKNIVVINSDPEAPFFKSADYGIVGDAFVVVPKLIEEIKKIKN